MKLYAQRLERRRQEQRGKLDGRAGRVCHLAPGHDRGHSATPGHDRGLSGKAPARRTVPAERAPVAPLKRSISQVKLDANRRNALRSTGPRTAEGKRRSSMNALKHGLRAPGITTTTTTTTGSDAIDRPRTRRMQNMSLSPVLPGESASTYETIKAELEDDFHPRTPVERWLVENVAAQLWRLMRAADVERRLVPLEERRLEAAVGREGTDDEEEAPPASEVLARLYASGEAHPMWLLARYERGMQSMLLRMLTRLQLLQKRPNDALYSQEDRDSARQWRSSAYSNRWAHLRQGAREAEKAERPAADRPVPGPTPAHASVAPTPGAERTQPNPPAGDENPAPRTENADLAPAAHEPPDETNPPPHEPAERRVDAAAKRGALGGMVADPPAEPHNLPPPAAVKSDESVVQSGRFSGQGVVVVGSLTSGPSDVCGHRTERPAG